MAPATQSNEDAGQHSQGLLFEVAVVCNSPLRRNPTPESEEAKDPIQSLVSVLRSVGLIVEEVDGVNSDHFLKVITLLVL